MHTDHVAGSPEPTLMLYWAWAGANAMTKTNSRESRLHSQAPADAAWRYEQALVDADIEGLARDPEAERLIAAMTAAGLSPEQQVERITAMFLTRKAKTPEMT
jgi:hypothetical protein